MEAAGPAGAGRAGRWSGEEVARRCSSPQSVSATRASARGAWKSDLLKGFFSEAKEREGTMRGALAILLLVLANAAGDAPMKLKAAKTLRTGFVETAADPELSKKMLSSS